MSLLTDIQFLWVISCQYQGTINHPNSAFSIYIGHLQFEDIQ